MPSIRSKTIVLLVAAAACALGTLGCAHVPLRRNTINQARTVADIHQQQVLNNLAMFVYNPNSMPSFAYPTQGTNQVVNTASVSVPQTGSVITTAGALLGHFVYSSLGLSISGSYQSNEAFTLVPINDPRKLELMRCAYQRAVATCCGTSPSSTCPDCQARFNAFYTGDVDGNIREKTGGIITSECLDGPCWFRTGCRKCLPKKCECLYVGHYCGVYVWVPAEGRDGLTKLTMTILDYAMHDPPVRLGKAVEFYIDENGLPTSQREAVGKVSASVGINERNDSLLHMNARDASALELQLKSQLDAIDTQLAPLDLDRNSPQVKALIDDRRRLAAKLEYLKSQVNNEGLMNEFVPRDQTLLGPSSPGPISPNILQYQQLLNQIK